MICGIFRASSDWLCGFEVRLLWIIDFAPAQDPAT